MTARASRPTRAASRARPPRLGKPPSGSASDGAARRLWQADQLWSHSSDEGEDWLLIRLARPTNKRTSQSPLLRKPSRLLAAVDFSVALHDPINDLGSCNHPPVEESSRRFQRRKARAFCLADSVS